MVKRYDNRNGDERTEEPRMKTGEMYDYINYKRKPSGCAGKTKYPTSEDAAKAARDYERRILFTSMNAYHCARCKWWHKGHDNKRWLITPQFREDVEWFAMLERKNAGKP